MSCETCCRACVSQCCHMGAQSIFESLNVSTLFSDLVWRSKWTQCSCVHLSYQNQWLPLISTSLQLAQHLQACQYKVTYSAMNSVLINLCFSSALICPLLFCSKKIKRYLILVRNCWASSKLFLNGKGLLICSDASTDFSDTSWLPPIIFGRIRMHTNCSRAL